MSATNETKLERLAALWNEKHPELSAHRVTVAPSHWYPETEVTSGFWSMPSMDIYRLVDASERILRIPIGGRWTDADQLIDYMIDKLSLSDRELVLKWSVRK